MKNVRAVVELGPNYICHLMAIAKIGFDSDYASKYQNSVRAEDVDVLKSHKELIQWQDGHTGRLTSLLFFVPCYFGLHTKGALKRYFDLLLSGLNSGHFRDFLTTYNEQIRNQQKWLLNIDEDYLGSFIPDREVINLLANIYLNNFDTYHDEVWPKESTAIQQVANKLNAYFAKKNIIGKWEQLTGEEFLFGTYQIVLCSAIKNGPNANSLGYERNIFYSGSGYEWMKQFISHETGTHILINAVRPLLSSGARDDFDIIYTGYENMCRFYNSMIIGKDEIYHMGPHYHDSKWFAIYEQIIESRPTISAQELLETAVRHFQEKR